MKEDNLNKLQNLIKIELDSMNIPEDIDQVEDDKEKLRILTLKMIYSLAERRKRQRKDGK